MEIGSQAHKELFCRTFLEGHHKYEPEDLPWPDLQGEALALLQGIPFWDHAFSFEADAGPMVYATAAVAEDPLIREALELQGYEETRHSRLVKHLVERYDIEVAPYVPEKLADDIEGEYIDFGFEECLDSFGAFGIFQLARESNLLPDEIFQIFDNVMREESHHIVFFINWYAHREVSRGAPASLLRTPRSLWHYAKALYKLTDLVRDDGADDGADFIVTGAAAFVDELTPHLVLRHCIAENQRRMAPFDPRLLQPRLVPRFAGAALAALRAVPERWFASGQGGATSEEPGAPSAA